MKKKKNEGEEGDGEWEGEGEGLRKEIEFPVLLLCMYDMMLYDYMFLYKVLYMVRLYPRRSLYNSGEKKGIITY